MAIMVCEPSSAGQRSKVGGQEANEHRLASPSAANHALARLTLANFRCFAEAGLAFEPGLVVLLGANGAGKTNLLEAISLLVPGKGLKGAKLADMTRRGANDLAAGWSVAAELPGLAGPIKLGTGLTADAAGRDRRVFRLEGSPASPRDVGEHMRLAWLTPAMDGLFEDSASARRRFFDRLVAALDAAHAPRLARYERALAERQRLLKEGTGTPAWLSGLERVLVEEGVAIAAARQQMLAFLRREIAAGGPWAEEELFPRAGLALEGEIEAALEAKPAVGVEGDFERALAEGRARDAAAGRALVGAHRTELKVRHLAKDMPAEICSTGEQKALVLNIVLAHVAAVAAETGRAPVLLLDEVAAHLDEVRREALFAALGAGGVQVFMTGTDEGAFAGLAGKAQFFEIAAGRAEPSARSAICWNKRT
jgi:DNA replication and repair protein RecF